MAIKLLVICILYTLIPNLTKAQVYDTINTAKKDSAQYYYIRSLKESRAGHPLIAHQLIQKAAGWDSLHLSILKQLAYVLLDLRQYNKTREVFLRLLHLGDDSAEILKNLMSLSFQLKQ